MPHKVPKTLIQVYFLHLRITMHNKSSTKNVIKFRLLKLAFSALKASKPSISVTQHQSNSRLRMGPKSCEILKNSLYQRRTLNA